MSDQMKIVGKDGQLRYIVNGSDVLDLNHVHVFDEHGKCTSCRLTEQQLQEVNDVSTRTSESE